MNIPTTAELAQQFTEKFQSFLPKFFSQIAGKMFAGVYITLYKFAAFIALQMFVSSASGKEINLNNKLISPLTEWGRLVGAGDPRAATQAILLISIKVRQQGEVLKASETTVVSTDNNVTYALVTDLLLNAENVTGNFQAVSDADGFQGAGTQGNLEEGSIVSFTTPYASVEADAEVAGIFQAGIDAQNIDEYRSEVEKYFRARPQGGAAMDYVIWAKQAKIGQQLISVSNVYPFTADFPGMIELYCEVTATEINPDGIPTPAELTAIKEAVEKDEGGLAYNRPLSAIVDIFPITRLEIDVEVYDLIAESLTELETEIETALTEYFLTRENFVTGVTDLPKKTDISVENIRSIINDYAVSADGSFSSVVLKFSLTQISFFIYTLQKGEKAKLGTLSFLTS